MTTPNGRASSAGHFRVRASINGRDLGVFESREGGETVAETSKHTPGNSPSMRVALGGPRDTSDVTISRAFVASRDHALIKQFQPLCGLAEMTVTQAALDKDGRELPSPAMWTGVLRQIGPPGYTAGDASVATFEIVMTCDGDVT